MDKKNPAFLMAGQFTFECEKQRLDIIKKGLTTCADTGKIVPNSTYWELVSEGEGVGPACTCYKCRKTNESSRRKFR